MRYFLQTSEHRNYCLGDTNLNALYSESILQFKGFLDRLPMVTLPQTVRGTSLVRPLLPLDRVPACASQPNLDEICLYIGRNLAPWTRYLVYVLDSCVKDRPKLEQRRAVTL